MLCSICQNEARKFGRNRNGSRRYRCDSCARTFTDGATRPADGRKLDAEKRILCLRMLLEGNSIRSVERLTRVHRDTIIDVMVDAGRKCKRFLESAIQGIPVADIEADEVWGFVGCHEGVRIKNGYDDTVGDAYCFTGFERTTKLIVAWHLGKRSVWDTDQFTQALRRATVGRFQLTTDGYKPYIGGVPAVRNEHRLRDVDEGIRERRIWSTSLLSPEVIGIKIKIRSGNPNEDRICTSYVERHNRSIRMAVRRMTRLTDAHSKKWDNHEAALALFFAYYNFCRVHSTIKTTPAVAAGLADHT